MCELNTRAYSKIALYFFNQKGQLFHVAQLEQIKVNALCMINSKSIHRGFLGPELKLSHHGCA